MALLAFVIGLLVASGARTGARVAFARRLGEMPTAFTVGLGPFISHLSDRVGLRLLPIWLSVTFGPRLDVPATSEDAEPASARSRALFVLVAPVAACLAAFTVSLVSVLAFGQPVATTEVTVLDESAARDAGLGNGDRIVAIDG